MDERELRRIIEDVRHGRLGRRRFVQMMVGLGLTAPMAAHMLASAGVAQAQAKNPVFNPTRRGGGGPLRVLWWQAPTLLNPHFATGTKDQDASRIFYEPLCSYDPDGNLVPVLAAEVPSVQRNTLAKDGTWVIWKLKRDVAWHDGKPFTADDVVFNWEFVKDPATAAVTSGSYTAVERAEKIDSHTVKLVFGKPQPFWYDAFCGFRGMIIPKHVFDAYKGAKSREAPANVKPVGTGPYKFVDFKPGDAVRGEINQAYHVPNRPFFDTVEMKGGGDAASAARAVLQTGEYDYAWNLQVEDDILRRLEQGGKGRVEIWPGGNPEHIQLNQTDPGKEVDGERSSVKTTHPFLTDPAVRQALSLLSDRAAIQEQIYGRGGKTSPNFLSAPSRFYSRNTRWEFNVDKAAQALDAGGWKRGADGIREKGGVKVKMVFQTSINAPRQKTQAIVKQACQKAGIEVELKSVTPSVYFSSDVGNPDTYRHFYTDIQMFTTTMSSPDPENFMRQFLSSEVASKENKWQGRNITRWRSDAYDKAFEAAEGELDPVKRAALFIAMNDMVVGDPAVIPVVYRPGVSAMARQLRANLSGWDNVLWDLANWYREA